MPALRVVRRWRGCRLGDDCGMDPDRWTSDGRAEFDIVGPSGNHSDGTPDEGTVALLSQLGFKLNLE